VSVSDRQPGSASPARLPHLDLLRGVAVLVMIEAHTMDSWTRIDERGRAAYEWALFVGGFGAPSFLFLAGLTLTLAAGTRLERGVDAAAVAKLARRRGWQIFGLALLFRLYSLLVSGGTFAKLIKVDILNIMGLAMLGAAVLWRQGSSRITRGILLLSAALAVAFVTPFVHALSPLGGLPDPIEWYLRPPPGRTDTFMLFPWAGFLFAGAAVGVWLQSSSSPIAQRAFNRTLLMAGPAIAAAGLGASYLPAIYPTVDFWHTSPTFFLIRLGILLAALPAADWCAARVQPSSWLHRIGAASLFVYWVHVEIVYGLLTLPIHRRLTFEQALVGAAAFSALMVWLVRLKERVERAVREKESTKVTKLTKLEEILRVLRDLRGSTST
jgi:uncharacterized membrane protein